MPVAMLNRARLTLFAGGLAILGVALAWRFTGLAEIASLDRIERTMDIAREAPWAFLLVIAIFVSGGAIAFPATFMVLATSAVFGPWFGALYSVLGIATSCAIMYGVGAYLGKDALARQLGPRGTRALEAVRARGALTVMVLRLISVLPFTIVNLAAGASAIRPLDFALGTLLGMMPGLIVATVMGNRIVAFLANPSLGDIAFLAACALAYLAVVFSVQVLLSRRQRGRHR